MPTDLGQHTRPQPRKRGGPRGFLGSALDPCPWRAQKGRRRAVVPSRPPGGPRWPPGAVSERLGTTS
eukprot:3117961-Pyramimonas_sp.AAC.1